MKHQYKTALLIALPVVLLFTGCTKDFQGINTDTNKSSSETYVPAYNLTRAQLEFTGNSDFSYETWRVNIIYCGMMTQQLANTGWYAGDKYIQNDAFASSYFDVAFRDQVKYVMDLLQITKDKPIYSNLYQAGRILRVLIFHRITDLYGDIPYSEAGLGYYQRAFTPKYDAQSSIYGDMLKELDEAAKALDPAKDKLGANDLIYRGATNEIVLWKKFAYSLMLRLAMRLTKVDAANAKTWAEKAYAGGLISSNAESAYIIHDAAGGRTTVNRTSNILSGEWDATTRGEVLLSKTFVDFLKNNNDPRLQYYAQIQSTGVTDPSVQVGMPNGYDQNGGATDISHASNYPGNVNKYSCIRSKIMLKLNAPTLLVTYAQVELLLAEAAKRGWSVGESADAHYKKGVSAAMGQLQLFDASAVISEGDAAAYLTAHPYVDASGLQQINTQYWAACFLDWYETWSNWRRSEYPTLVPVNYVGNATGGKIPRRMLYPSSEASANGANLSAALTRQGDNIFMTRVWWDKP